MPGLKKRKTDETSCLIFPSSKDDNAPEVVSQQQDPSHPTVELSQDEDTDTQDQIIEDPILLIAAFLADIRDAYIETRDMLRCDLEESENEPLPLSAALSGLTSSRPSSRFAVMPITTSKSTPQRPPSSVTASTRPTMSSLLQRLTPRTTSVSPSSMVPNSHMPAAPI